MRQFILPMTLLLFAVTLLCAFAMNVRGDGAAEDDLARADRHFREKSYSPALEAYRLVLADGSRPIPVVGHAFLRASECERRLKTWDLALRRLESIPTRLEGSVWEARALALRGEISATMPHYYYQKDEQISRESWIQGATYHYTYYDDLIAALKDLEAAVSHFDQLKETWAAVPGDDRDRTRREYVEACILMAKTLEAHRDQKGGLEGLEAATSVKSDYKKHGIGSHGGVAPQGWYRRGESMARELDSIEHAAKARYLEAMFARRLLDHLNVHSTRLTDKDYNVRCRIGGTDEEPVLVQLPEALNPFRLFELFLKDYGKTQLTDSAVYAFAHLAKDYGHYTKSLEVVKDFDQRFPKSIWKSDVAALELDIRFPRLTAQNPPAVRPGENVVLKLATRNVKTVQISAWKVDLRRFLADRAYLRDSDAQLQSVAQRLEARSASQYVTSRPVYTQALTTPDEGKHQSHEVEAPLVFADPGAYLIEVASGNTRYRVLSVVSDLALVRKLGETETIVSVVNATTGAPVEGAKVLIRQRHPAKGLFGRYQKVTHDWSETSAQGVTTREHEDAGTNWLYIETFAADGEH
ncbi:MAG: hypothetical protein KDB53_02985, partial [Planctomycetes bacterium]|nr:hypothetical protein [Planctomycetota bacterium]